VRTPSKLLPDIDYTIDGGKIILTETFLLRRGFCCNTKCRHCPYKGERASAPIVILGFPKSPVAPLAAAPPGASVVRATSASPIHPVEPSVTLPETKQTG
jgi:hypothetical protein